MEVRETIELSLSARPAIYGVLQAFFGREPQAEVVASLASTEFLQVAAMFFECGLGTARAAGVDTNAGDAANAAGVDTVSVSVAVEETGEPLESCVAALQAAARACLEGGEDALDALDSAYTRLFVGPRCPEAAPWESAYVGDEGLLFQPSTLAVRKAYVSQGLIPSRYPRIAEDHLAIELGFLASLGQRAADAYREGDADGFVDAVTASREFLDEHLRRWLPPFCEALDRSDCGPLYREASWMLDAFIQADAAFLEEAGSIPPAPASA